jgi:tetratricopeptide (TPR) repeat protein
MGGLGTVLILLTLGASGQDAPPAEETAPAETGAPGTAPAPPIQYLKAGILFFNTGKYEQAGKYLEAANRFRDQLTDKERVVLDVYRDGITAYQEELRQAAARPAKDPDLVQASRATVEPPKAMTAVTRPDGLKGAVRADGLRKSPVVQQRASSNDTKQQARWLLHEAREQIQRGHFDLAEKKVAEARALDVKWGFLDDSPDKVAKSIIYVRKHRPDLAKAAETQAPDAPHDLRTARARLAEARAAMAQNQVDRAEQIARDVQTWGLDFGRSDDSPEKILATVRAVKLLETIRKNGGELPAEK